ncbi:alpha/beta hydrolase [Amycolatopsis sp. Poz14]|uniref:alpha/beta hydrolase n=1 Tax=Amycolatopsis sp. Poz14 TaxID=1447705 RepID=UPI001EE915EE|nr:alpha/beta hydrolase [Amycolatopsis sp. Poz14]MCG3751953.1 alpha/beta hydrolase [Amycolatopsis sp. Poz14]
MTSPYVARKVGPPPPFDPELEPALAALREQMPRAATAEDIPLLRDFAERLRLPDERLNPRGRYDLREVTVPGPDETSEVPLLVCRPAAAHEPVGVIFHMHGGGMVIGDNRGPETARFLGWADELGLALVSVDYRLAPEHPYPAAIEDCYAGLKWTIAHAGELGIDPRRIVVAGASAGAGLAASLALLSRDRGGPDLAAQLLLCPMLDDRNDTPSAHQMSGLGVADRQMTDVAWTALLGDRRGTADVPPYASPARAEDLSGLPPAFLDVGSAETFRDEVLDYAARIWQAGGQAELHVWPGGFHGFYGYAPDAAVSRQATAARVPWLRRVLGL